MNGQATSKTELLEGKYSTVVERPLIQEMMRCCEHRVDSKESVSTAFGALLSEFCFLQAVDATGCLKAAKFYAPAAMRMQAVLSYEPTMHWRFNTVAELRMLPVLTPEVCHTADVCVD